MLLISHCFTQLAPLSEVRGFYCGWKMQNLKGFIRYDTLEINRNVLFICDVPGRKIDKSDKIAEKEVHK